VSVRLHGQDYSAASLARMAGDLAAAGGVRSVVLGDGAERGVRALEFRTGGGLNFDVLVDRGHGYPHMFRYHINVGWPLLEEGARFEAPIARTTWASDSVASQGASHLVLGRRSRGSWSRSTRMI
jgi:Domain of unknown function (DUF4432)